MKGRVLVIAGSDSGGGAGLQADIRTITALGGYACSAVSAITAQNTLEISRIAVVDADMVAAQMEAVLTDIGADAIKCGMLPTADIVAVVCDVRARLAPDVPLIVDPVMVATSGAALADDGAASALREKLLPVADLITPNMPEAAWLADMAVLGAEDMESAGARLRRLGAGAVLVSGGHLDSDPLVDVLVTARECKHFRHKRIAARGSHGTGCTLTSAIATGIAQGMALEPAIKRAISYVGAALEAAPGFGRGNGPLGLGRQ